jgi:hypothetical protein
MGWETRAGRRYGYRCLRIEGQPRKLYLGTGSAAADHARQLAQRQQQRQAEREALHAEQARVAAADRALAELRAMTGLLARAGLLLAGLHEHHGEWRRRTKS